ncbi:3-oxoacyl-ACP reductase FabG [Brevibacterium sp. CSND-B09]|uniref:3-oxoacyl-ACP reductase FabG n=1 Tax=Brevibacterium sp. CSND-B09 TaxID=3462571 RepID=UPI00406A2722
MKLLENRTAVVTGGAQGLGYAIARAFADAGADVVIGDLDGEAAAAAASSLDIGDRAIGVTCDVVNLDQVEHLCATAVERFGSLDVMVNNAGITRDATMRKMSEEQFDQVIAVHLRGTWNGLRSASGLMRDQSEGGSIINVSSIAGKVGNLGQTNYSAAKAGIVGMTKAAAKEVGFKNVRVNAIQPGFINTPMTAAMRPDRIEAKIADIPMGRAGEPSEIASAVTFLASDMASYITGVVLEIAGGRHI